MTRLICTESGSSRFWEGETKGATLVVRFGRVGTAGQSRAKECKDAAAAGSELAKVVREKRAKGYVDDTSAGAEGGAAPEADGKDAVDGGANARSSTPAAAAAKVGGSLPGGYRLEIDALLEARIYNAGGTLLASVPEAVKKSREWQQWLAVRESFRQRERENARTVEEWMLAAQQVSLTRLAALYADPAWRKSLAGLLVEGEGGRGLLVGADRDKGLGLLTLELDTLWARADAWRIPHTLTIADLAKWLKVASEAGVTQHLAQLVRPVLRPEPDEAGRFASARYQARELSSAARATWAFGGRGWLASHGTALRTFTLRVEGAVRRVVAEFDYFAQGDEYGDWNVACETGELRFFEEQGDEQRALRLRDVPLAAYSEACVDIEAALTACA